MATNGESARQWLKDNHGKVSGERIQQIIQSIQKKVAALTDEHADYIGLVEALDVMEAYNPDQADRRPTSESLDTLLDATPLISEDTHATALISPEEKKRRFQALLKRSDV